VLYLQLGDLGHQQQQVDQLEYCMELRWQLAQVTYGYGPPLLWLCILLCVCAVGTCSKESTTDVCVVCMDECVAGVGSQGFQKLQPLQLMFRLEGEKVRTFGQCVKLLVGGFTWGG
jgi:hypothetical protein